MRGGRAHDDIQRSGVIHEYIAALMAKNYALADRIAQANSDINLRAIHLDVEPQLQVA